MVTSGLWLVYSERLCKWFPHSYGLDGLLVLLHVACRNCRVCILRVDYAYYPVVPLNDLSFKLEDVCYLLLIRGRDRPRFVKRAYVI